MDTKGHNETIALMGMVILGCLSMYLLKDAQIVNTLIAGLVGYVGGRSQK